MISTVEKAFYSVTEVCELVGVSRATVDRLAQKNAIPGRVRVGGLVKYHKETVDQWIASKGQVQQGASNGTIPTQGS